MAPSVSKPKTATQQTLFGFFGKASNASPSVPSARPPSRIIASPVRIDDTTDESLTPPPTIRKVSVTSTSSTIQSRPSLTSPTDVRNTQKKATNGVRSASELTPPSSSPPREAEEEDDDEDQIARFPRRRAAVKRSIQYIESDDEATMDVDSAGDDDDDDRYSPEKDGGRPSKKSKHGRRASLSDDDDDDEFNDFIVPDDELLGALDEAEAMNSSVQSKKKLQTGKPKPVSVTITKPKATTTPTPWSSSARPTSSSAISRPTLASTGKKPSSDELPYDFLTNPMDANKNLPTHPDYDPRTLYIPQRTFNTLTPFEKQYWEIKRKNNDCVLFFQKGKFYELYEDDALIAHREFGLKVTDRVKMKMAGVPESSYTMFANKFLALGYKVGRVDQTETAVGKDMRQAGSKSKASSVAGSDDSGSKIVRRDLRSIMTAGTIVDADCLPDDMSSYCICIKEVVEDDTISGHSASGLTGGDDEESMSASITFGVCILDAGTAQFTLHHFVDDVTRTKFETMLRSLRIKEVLYEKGHLSKRSLRIIRNTVDPACNITMLKPDIEFLDKDSTLRKLNLVFNENLADCDPTNLKAVDPIDTALLPEAIAESLDKEEAMNALGGMLSYLTQLNLEKDLCASKKFDIFDHLAQNDCMILDAQSLTHLNVLLNEQGNTQGTLLQLINRAVTPFGKRLMKVWLLSPLARIEAIQDRQNAVEELLRESTLADDFDAFAKSLPDIERIMPRIYAGNCKSKEFAKVLSALGRVDGHVEEWKELASRFDTQILSQLLDIMPSVSSQAKAIHSKYQDESFEPKRGGDEEYDEADQEVSNVERDLNHELAKAAQQVKLPRDKVKFKDVGTNEIYQIEVPIKTNVPLDWSLTSQTQSVKRYYSNEVRGLVKQLKEAREVRVAALKAFQRKLFEEFQVHGHTFLEAVKGLAELDCLISLAKASRAMNEPTCRPELINSKTAVIEFKDLRHPCLANASSSDFIANDITLGGETEEAPTVTILTGGNMAGKSTTARTTATGVILAQLGCRVPAMEARLSPIDRIATRMGANDQIFRKNSTFMVEMLEASRILKDGSPRSLVIMDELGRGTSTFDGQAIAYSVLHYLIGQSRCLSFFLTHYTQLAYDFEGHLGVVNKHMQVLVDSDNKEVVFTYRLVDGIAESSYGTEVASLAGIPSEICQRAHSISKQFLESTREMEANRKHNVESKLETATISDFVYLLRAAINESADEKEAPSSKTISFMQKQISHLFTKMDQGDIYTSDAGAVSGEPRVYRRRSKKVQDDEIIVEPGISSLKTKIAVLLPEGKSKSKEEQMILDFGQRIQVDCKDCGMAYDRSDAQDVSAHEKYHSELTKGVEWKIHRQSRQLQQLCLKTKGDKSKEMQVKILAYDCDKLKMEAATMTKLEQIRKDMDQALGAAPLPLSIQSSTKMIVAVSDGRVVGSLIAGATPRDKARIVEDSIDGATDGAVFVPNEFLPAERTPPLGIYRIHVLPVARRVGLASAMLDAALEDCVYGTSAQSLIQMYNGKANTTAFSQPTQAGRYLAEAWIRRGHDQQPGHHHHRQQRLIVFDESNVL